mgnify:CR=1 FL=1
MHEIELLCDGFFTICKNRNNQYSSDTFLLNINNVMTTVTIATIKFAV